MLLFFILWGYLFSPLFDFYHIFIYAISTLPRMYYVTNQMVKWNILCRRYLNVLRDVISNEAYQRNTFDSKIWFVFISSCLCVLLTLFVFVCMWWCPSHIMLCFCFVFLRLVCPMLPVSLDYTLFTAPLVFSIVYLWSYVNVSVAHTHQFLQDNGNLFLMN